MKTYNIQGKVPVLRDRSRHTYKSPGPLSKQVQAKDYFGTAATVVDLCAQLIDKKPAAQPVHKSSAVDIRIQLKHVRDELMYIHENYELTKKE